ncbi:MAG: hypothetical protein K2X08_07150 [Chlamydiales bacterium]|nr:hypothetical protein [Chlamydiales bacterium]
MTSFVVYGTPADQLSSKYPFTPWPVSFSQDIRTQLPKNIAIIRAVAIVAFTALIAYKVSTTVFFWPVLILGAAFAAKTVYSHLYVKDPLVKAFDQIIKGCTAVGKEDFLETLPKIHLQPNSHEKIYHAICKLKWENLDLITKASTLDGRKIILIKGGRKKGQNSVHHRKILVFMEKVGPNDLPRGLLNLSELTRSVLHAVLPPFKDNTFGLRVKPAAQEDPNFTLRIYSSISGAMAKEFFAQLRTDEL